jgi:hypothetical protein
MIHRTTLVLATLCKWFLLALEHERNSSFAPLNLLWLHLFCPYFPAKTQYFQMHIRCWTCYIISVPSGGLVENHKRNQCIKITLGWRKFTVNRRGRQAAADMQVERCCCSRLRCCEHGLAPTHGKVRCGRRTLVPSSVFVWPTSKRRSGLV